MNWVLSFVSAEKPGPSEREIVQKLCCRVESSTLLQDRRDAVRGLRSLSRKFRRTVGEMGLDLMVKVFRERGLQDDMLKLALDCLCDLMIVEDDEEDEEEQIALAKSFAGKFIVEDKNVVCLIEQVENPEFSVRWGAIRLLKFLLRAFKFEVVFLRFPSFLGL